MRIDMKKKQILTGVVERVDFPNKAVVKAQVPQPDESVATEYAIVKGALPGQTVEFSVKKARKNKCEGRLRTVLKKGQLETERRSVQILVHVVAATIRKFRMNSSSPSKKNKCFA